MSARDRVILLALCVAAFALRLWDVADVPIYVGDEGLFVPASINFFRYNMPYPEGWINPPFYYYPVRASLALFGDNPYGWRMANVIMGSLSVLVIVLLAVRVFGDFRVGAVAAVLMAGEPFCVYLSRSAFIEVAVVFWFLLAIYFILGHLQGNRHAVLAGGVCLGLALATKWYFLLAMPMLILFCWLYLRRKQGAGWLEAVHLVVTLGVLPLLVYLLIYYPWFRRGNDLVEFLAMQYETYRANQAIKLEYFDTDFLQSAYVPPFFWFVKPIIQGELIQRVNGMGSFFVFMNNPPVALLTLPSVLYLGYRSWKKKAAFPALVVLLFAVLYLQFALVRRPILLYSLMVVLPFAFLAVAATLVQLVDRMGKPRTGYGFLLAACALWGLYLYPLATSRMVPIALYGWLVGGLTGLQ